MVVRYGVHITAFIVIKEPASCVVTWYVLNCQVVSLVPLVYVAPIIPVESNMVEVLLLLGLLEPAAFVIDVTVTVLGPAVGIIAVENVPVPPFIIIVAVPERELLPEIL